MITIMLSDTGFLILFLPTNIEFLRVRGLVDDYYKRFHDRHVDHQVAYNQNYDPYEKNQNFD
jgi:hypothetical protein